MVNLEIHIIQYFKIYYSQFIASKNLLIINILIIVAFEIITVFILLIDNNTQITIYIIHWFHSQYFDNKYNSNMSQSKPNHNKTL